MPPSLAVAAAPAVQVDSQLMASFNGALMLVTVLTPLLSAELVEVPCRALGAALPPVGAAVARSMRAIADACHALRTRRLMLFMLLHGALTYITGDLIAQAAVSGRSGGATKAGASDEAPSSAAEGGLRRRRAVGWHQLRSARAALVGILSDTLPFYYWSSALEKLDQSWVVRRLPVLLRKPGLMLATKVGVHVFTFQPACTASYLLLQQLLRGQSLPSALRFLKRTLVAALAPALVSFLAGGPVIYSLR